MKSSTESSKISNFSVDTHRSNDYNSFNQMDEANMINVNLAWEMQERIHNGLMDRCEYAAIFNNAPHHEIVSDVTRYHIFENILRSLEDECYYYTTLDFDE